MTVSENSSQRSSTAVTIDDGFVTTSSSDEENCKKLRQRSGYVSRHRIVLDRIKTDAAESRRHEVPGGPQQQQNGSMHGADEGGGGGVGVSVSMQSRRANAWLRQALIKFSRTGDHFDRKKTCSDWTETFLPMWRWMKDYKWKQDFVKDFVAGLTVGIMIIPQSMSYAKLAGLPVEFGLYSALVPVYVYALFGSSRQLAVGPVAIVSLLLSAGLSEILDKMDLDKEGNPDEYQSVYNRLAVQTSFLVGIVYIVMGLLRLGFVTIFLSHAVVSGFTTGASVIIGMSQVKYIFGYNIPNSKELQKLLKNLFQNIDEFNYRTFVMGTLSVLALLGLKHVGKTIPKLKWVRAGGPLAVTVISIVLVVTLGLDDRGVPLVGSIPKGLPSFTVSELTPFENVGDLSTVVITIVIVGFMESIAIAKQLASKHKYEIDASTELVGLGLSNLAGGMVNAYPVTGSFSRSAVNNDSGAVSGISGVVTATLVMFVLLVLTAVFEKMPLCVLAAIVISGVIGLLDYEEAIQLWKVNRFDFAVWMVACLGSLFLGVEIGLAIAVAISLLIVIYESAYPHTSVLGRLPGTTVYRNIKQYPESERYDGIVIMRIDAPLYFANALNIREKIRKYRLAAEAELEARNGEVKFLILEMGPVSHVDTTALHVLDDMNANYQSRGQQLLFSNPNLVVMDRFVRSGLADKVGREHFFACLHDAVNWALQRMDCEAISLHESIHDKGVEEIESGVFSEVSLLEPDGDLKEH